MAPHGVINPGYTQISMQGDTTTYRANQSQQTGFAGSSYYEREINTNFWISVSRRKNGALSFITQVNQENQNYTVIAFDDTHKIASQTFCAKTQCQTISRMVCDQILREAKVSSYEELRAKSHACEELNLDVVHALAKRQVKDNADDLFTANLTHLKKDPANTKSQSWPQWAGLLENAKQNEIPHLAGEEYSEPTLKLVKACDTYVSAGLMSSDIVKPLVLPPHSSTQAPATK